MDKKKNRSDPLAAGRQKVCFTFLKPTSSEFGYICLGLCFISFFKTIGRVSVMPALSSKDYSLEGTVDSLVS